MTFRPATYKEALQRKPLKRGGRIKPRRYSKTPTEDGASVKELRDEMDALVRTILHMKPTSRTGEICFIVGCYQSENLHVSHFIKRGVLALRWSLDNCHLMCDPHNEQHNYNQKLYRQAMNLWLTPERVAKIERIGKENPQLEYSDLLAIRDGLRREAARMVNQK